VITQNTDGLHQQAGTPAGRVLKAALPALLDGLEGS
jgi:NAD-dependent SIR2 family protein deacetylase